MTKHAAISPSALAAIARAEHEFTQIIQEGYSQLIDEAVEAAYQDLMARLQALRVNVGTVTGSAREGFSTNHRIAISSAMDQLIKRLGGTPHTSAPVSICPDCGKF